MKIKAKNQSIKSMKLSVPVDGLIEIDDNGIAEVSEKCGKMLINGTRDWKEFEIDKVVGKSGKDDEQGEKDANESETENFDSVDDGKATMDKEIIAGLNELSLDSCIETAKEAGYPESEWEKLAKNEKAAEKLMRKYLVRKYKESIKK